MSAIEKLLEQQARVPEYSAPWMVAEQLMDICRREPHSAQLIDQDLDNPEMGIVQAEAKIRAYSDANHKGATCFCVTPDSGGKNPAGVLRAARKRRARQQCRRWKGSGLDRLLLIKRWDARRIDHGRI